MIRNTLFFSLAFALTLSSRVPAQAADSGVVTRSAPVAGIDTGRFSKQGRTLLAGSVNGHWTSNPNGRSDWSVSIQPSLGRFLRDSFALGLTPGYAAGSEVMRPVQGVRFQEVSLSAYALWQVPLGERLSWLVIPSVGYAFRWRTSDVNQQQLGAPLGQIGQLYVIDRTQHGLRVALNLPFVYHFSDSVVAGLGPYFQFDQLFFDNYAEGSLSIPGLANATFEKQDQSYTFGVSSFIGATF